MNAAIRAATRTALAQGAEVVGIRRGYAGLIAGDFQELSARDVGGILERGGTILESARSAEFRTEEGLARGVRALEEARIGGVVVIGGNGSQTGALALSNAGVPVNGVASTIDNDLAGSDITIGVDSALNVAVEAIDRLRTTATSHHRLFIVEVMGRDCGYLALAAGIAGGAEVIVMPESDISPEEAVELVHDAHRRGKKHAIIVIAEGARPCTDAYYQALLQDRETCFDPRLTILGHIQRGGRPTAADRLLATRLAGRAVEMLLAGDGGKLIGTIGGSLVATPLAEIAGKSKPLPRELLDLVSIMRL
jgi:6-phosphofructokinase 1